MCNYTFEARKLFVRTELKNFERNICYSFI